uniref:Uncharacterized protein n=1 Tax=Rhizophagus irregularis (strain DAOM 181602 / DAOM 197198 / MUCL 43194) TaxID=747089 RepID=U9TUT0_RHIID
MENIIFHFYYRRHLKTPHPEYKLLILVKCQGCHFNSYYMRNTNETSYFTLFKVRGGSIIKQQQLNIQQSINFSITRIALSERWDYPNILWVMDGYNPTLLLLNIKISLLSVNSHKIKAHPGDILNDNLSKEGTFLQDPLIIDPKFFSTTSVGFIAWNDFYVIDRNIRIWAHTNSEKIFNSYISKSSFRPIQHLF